MKPYIRSFQAVHFKPYNHSDKLGLSELVTIIHSVRKQTNKKKTSPRKTIRSSWGLQEVVHNSANWHINLIRNLASFPSLQFCQLRGIATMDGFIWDAKKIKVLRDLLGQKDTHLGPP